MIKKIHIYDLDGVLVNSMHRYRNLPNGSIDLKYWFANQIPEQIAKDTLLPMAARYKAAIADSTVYVIIATARLCKACDFKFIREQLGQPDKIICRVTRDPIPDCDMKRKELKKLFQLKQFKNLEKHFWDDSIKNLYAVSELGVYCYHIQD